MLSRQSVGAFVPALNMHLRSIHWCVVAASQILWSRALLGRRAGFSGRGQRLKPFLNQLQFSILIRSKWLGPVLVPPCIEAAFKSNGVPTHRSQLMRRTGAGRFILSGAVSDNPAVWLEAARPDRYLVRRNPDVVRQSSVVMLVTHARANIQDYGRFGRLKLLV